MNNERRPSRDYLGRGARTLVCGEGATCTRNVPGGAARLGCTGPSCRIDYSDTEEEEEEDISLAFLRSKCDRLTERRATDFSQVDIIS